jgi:SAM-dependent methyltransferase
MSAAEVPAVVQWGAREIKGPVHLFRERMIVTNLQKHLPVGQILDAGCGTGSLTLELASLGYTVWGVDLSLECVEFVRQKAAQNGLSDRILAYQGDVVSLGLGRVGFDGVVCGEVLEHLRKDAPAVREFNRTLREGGICVVTVPANPKQLDEVDIYAGHFRRYTSEQLLRLFESNGFRIVHLRHWGFPLIRLYQRVLFRPYMKRMHREGAASQLQGAIARVGSTDLISASLAQLFRLDKLFERLPWGVGLVLVAEKCTDL